MRISPFRSRRALRGFTLIELMVAVTISSVIVVMVVSLQLLSARMSKELYEASRSQAKTYLALERVRYLLCMGGAGSANVTIANSGTRIDFKDPNLGSGVTSRFDFDAAAGELLYDDNINESPAALRMVDGLSSMTFKLLDGAAVVKVSAETEATFRIADERDIKNAMYVYLRN